MPEASHQPTIATHSSQFGEWAWHPALRCAQYRSAGTRAPPQSRQPRAKQPSAAQCRAKARQAHLPFLAGFRGRDIERCRFVRLKPDVPNLDPHEFGHTKPGVGSQRQQGCIAQTLEVSRTRLQRYLERETFGWLGADALAERAGLALPDVNPPPEPAKRIAHDPPASRG